MELTGKTVAFLGDSITEGQGTTSSRRRYDTLAGKALGFTPLNYGVGGTRIAWQSRYSEKPKWDLYFCGRAYTISPKADVIVVFGGTNDYGHGEAPFGTLADREPDTFCGAVDCLMRTLRQRHPKSRLAFLTPIRREGDQRPSDYPRKGPDARPLWDYAQVILEKGRELGIPVLDAYHGLPIDPNDPAQRAAYTVDGTHLNDAGQEKLAQLVAAFLQTL